MEINKIHIGNCLEVLKTLPDCSINMCVTSPPYWNLRDYGMSDQMGQEKTPQEFVNNLVMVFQEVKRVLKDDGTIWVNLGDTYLPGKQLAGIPWRVAFGLQDDGWILRQDNVWYKPNPMPESVTDRCTKAHEYIFHLAKNQKYYYDHEAIKEKMAESSISRLSQNIEAQKGSDRVPGKTNGAMKAVGKKPDKQRGHGRRHAGFNDRWDAMTKEEQQVNGRNKRSVWIVPTKPFSGAHFATYPAELITDCIKAGCPVGGVVLDPFFGSGTTGEVAERLDRKWIGIELNPEYAALAEKRLSKVFPLLKSLNAA